MIINIKIFHSKNLYNFFLLVSLTIFFFSTTQVQVKAFNINNIEISRPFEINFSKNEVIDTGFKNAFFELISSILKSNDQKKVNDVKLNEIKGMIESFSIKQESFINETYFVNLGVSFNKKKIFKYLESKNIFPSIPIKKKLLFIPIIINENKKDLLIFNNNNIFENWNKSQKSYYLIEYILPTEDLEDLNLIKNKYEFLERYNFKEIIDKYDLKDSIIALIFEDKKNLRVLSRITMNGNIVLKNQSFPNTNLKDQFQTNKMIDDLKVVYEDYWKNFNQINTSIKISLNIKVDGSDNFKISNFEKILDEMDLIKDFFILKFDKDFLYYQIVFNGSSNKFLKLMNNHNYNFDTQNKLWILK